MSCMTAVHDFKGNHIKFARFVLLAVSEDAKTTNKTVIRFGFLVISRIIKASVRVIVTPALTLIILDITRTESNNSFFLFIY